MQVYYWWFSARERWAARQAREREEEFRRAEKVAALRAGEDQPQIEAKLGAVVPRAQLPQEPALAQLPVDPVIPRETMPSASPMEHAAEHVQASQPQRDRRE